MRRNFNFLAFAAVAGAFVVIAALVAIVAIISPPELSISFGDEEPKPIKWA